MTTDHDQSVNALHNRDACAAKAYRVSGLTIARGATFRKMIRGTVALDVIPVMLLGFDALYHPHIRAHSIVTPTSLNPTPISQAGLN
jgi:hypothetical protein